jgi:hypothetical protein
MVTTGTTIKRRQGRSCSLRHPNRSEVSWAKRGALFGSTARPAPAEKKQAEDFEARRRAIYVTPVECGCGRIMKPGDPAHACNGVRETGPTSIDVSAAAFRRAGLAAALRELEQD